MYKKLPAYWLFKGFHPHQVYCIFFGIAPQTATFHSCNVSQDFKRRHQKLIEYTMIKRLRFTHLILGFLFLSLIGCGFPQIARYPSLNYTRNEYELALAKLWDSFSDYRVIYRDIVIYATELDKYQFFNGYKSELGIDSLSPKEVEYRFFHNDKSKIWGNWDLVGY